MIKHFTKKEDKLLFDNYLRLPSCTMSRMLKRSKSSARQRMKRLGIIVPAELIEQFKKQSHFKPGTPAVNKGLKQSQYMSAEAIKKVSQSWFKPGTNPANTKHDGAICIRGDKLGNRYQFIRLSEANWIPLHRYNWIQIHGAIPNGLKLIFKDGDTLNCSIDNLELLTAAELMKRNSFHNYPKPLAMIVQLRGALNRQINKKSKTIT
jgi:hypothetical protein